MKKQLILIPACPNCGVDGAYVFRSRRAYGWAKETWTPAGKFDGFCDDTIDYTDTETLRCEECEKVRPDIKIVERVIILT